MTTPTTAPTIDRPVLRWLAAVGLVTPALVAVGLIAALTYSLNAEYGMLADTGGSTISAFALGVMVTSVAVVPFSWFAVRIVSPDRARRHVWPIVGGSIGLVAAVLIGAGLFGEAAHSRGLSNESSACSDNERAALADLGAIPTNGEIGSGSRDGTCLGTLGGNGGDASAQEGLVTDVRARLAGSGWVPSGPVGDETEYLKDGRTLVVAIVRDGKTTAVTATFPPG
jgi:hypothetical protein